MKIRELRVKHFGKFQNARICLRDGINLVAGENESGKSTLHTFIRGMFFGLRRMRGIPPSIPENWFLKAEASGSGFPEISAEIRLQSV